MMVLFFLVYGAMLAYFCGYIFSLALGRRLFYSPLHPPAPSELPYFYVLVAFRNEEKLLPQKLANLAQLTYPREKLRILLIDGNSTDSSRSLALSWVAQNPHSQLLQSAAAGKVPQLNLGLAAVNDSSALVLVTDADATWDDHGCLEKVAGYFQANSGIALVGAWVRPSGASSHGVDLAYWDKQNRLRHMETIFHSSSIVVGPFYAFPRSLLSSFPANCVADDVYVSCLAHRQRGRVLYLSELDCVEHRNPSSLSRLFLHKWRKAHAYFRELLRLSPHFFRLRRRLRYLYAFKLFQFVLLPFLGPTYVFLSYRLLAEGNSLVFWANLWLGLLTLAASALMVPPPGRTRGGVGVRTAWYSVLSLALVNLALVANFFTFAFSRRNSSYRRYH